MNFQLIMSAFFILASVGLLMIISNQKQLVPELIKSHEKQKRSLKELHKQYVSVDSFKASLENLLAKGSEQIHDLEVTLTNFSPKIEEKETNMKACQGEMNTIRDELVRVENGNNEAKDALKAESDAWKQQIDNLNTQLSGHRSICDYVKDDPLARKLCGTG